MSLTRSIDRRRFIRTLAGFGAAIGLAGTAIAPHKARGTESVTLALDWYPNANHAGLFLAQERGYFQAENLAVDLYTPSDPTTVLQTVGAGQDDFGISYQTDVLLARAQGVPVVSVAALVQHPLLGVMSLKERGIVRPRDLVGKTVGYPGIPSQEAFLATMLESDGARMSDVTLINVGFNLVPAVISGRVDAVMGAYWTHETILAEREGHEVALMRVEDWGVPDYYELVLVTSESMIASHPGVIRSLLKAVQRGYKDAIEDPDAALEALSRAYEGVDREVEQQGIALLIPVWTDGGLIFGTQTPERWEAYAGWMKERTLIPEDLDVSKAFTTAFLPGAEGTPVAT